MKTYTHNNENLNWATQNYATCGPRVGHIWSRDLRCQNQLGFHHWKDT